MERKRDLVTGSGQYSAAHFPSDLGIHFISFSFRQTVFPGKSGEVEKIGSGGVFLPIPSNLIDALILQYNDVELGLVGGQIANMITGSGDKVNAIADLFKESMKMGLGEITGKLLSGTKSAIKKALEIAETELLSGGELISGMVRGDQSFVAVGLNRLYQNVPNPNIIAMFRGVNLRQHTFDWKLAPRNKEESTQLARIIKIFKYASLPGKQKDGKLLTFPYEALVTIHGTSTTGSKGSHEGVYEPLLTFKPVIIKSITVNYAPDNTPSFFAETGHPTAVSFRIELQETQIHTREDYYHEGDSLFKGSARDALAALGPPRA